MKIYIESQYVYSTLDDGTLFSDNTQYPGTDIIDVSSDVASISWLNV